MRPGPNFNLEKQKEPQMKRPTSSTFLTQDGTQPSKKGPMKSVYCSGLQYSASCNKVVDPRDRRDILIEAKRCFKCLYPDHRVKDCTSTKNCHNQFVLEQFRMYNHHAHHRTTSDKSTKKSVALREVRLQQFRVPRPRGEFCYKLLPRLPQTKMVLDHYQ